MMSTRNFYNAMTPGSHLGEEVMFGKSAYKQIAPSELNSKYVRNANKMPLAREGSLLNSINDHGLLSYTDFHFLLLLMSTPTRYLDIIFHGFDISADGSVEAKVAKSSNHRRQTLLIFCRNSSTSWLGLPMLRSTLTS